MDTLSVMQQEIGRKHQGAGKFEPVFISCIFVLLNLHLKIKHNQLLNMTNVTQFRYNESCPHGIITASKMLFLSESVRDVIDIKLSKKFNPPVNILGNYCSAWPKSHSKAKGLVWAKAEH